MSADSADIYSESSAAIFITQARLFAEAFRELVLNNSPSGRLGDSSSWWYRAARDGASNMAQYVDDTVLVDADEETIARLQHLALYVGVLPH